MLARNPFIASDTQLAHYSSFCSLSHAFNLQKTPKEILMYFFKCKRENQEKKQLSNALIMNNYKLLEPLKTFLLCDVSR